MNSPQTESTYDQILYPGHPFPQTHPDRLAAVGRLFGMKPTPIEACRVLELGCGDGGNLIPMGYTLPESTFVGLDLGARGIAIGQDSVSGLGLRNVTLQCLDILEARDLGKFDYILAHGVYSWVPSPVQERILEICGDHLNPQGVAFISYNVYPGAHVRNMMAEMLQYYVRRFPTPQEKIEQTGVLLEFLSSGHPLVRTEAERLAGRSPSGLFHDDLAEVHSAVYFREFVERASRHGLQYLGEADFFEMLDAAEEPEVRAALNRLARDPLDKEQLLDFLKCRRFRQTLLCRADAPLKRSISSSLMREFFIGRDHRKDTNPDKWPIDHPVARAAFDALTSAWPAVLSFDELLARSRTEDSTLLCDVVLGFYACGFCLLHVHRPRLATVPGDRPLASALARRQVAHSEYVTTLRHTVVHLEDDPSRQLLRALDGTRDRAGLLRELHLPETSAGELEAVLQGFIRLALLE